MRVRVLVTCLLSAACISVAAQTTDAAAPPVSSQQGATAQPTSNTAAAGDCPGGIVGGKEMWRLARATVGATIVSATNSQQAYQTDVIASRQRHPDVCGYPHQQTRANLRLSYDARQSSSKPGSTVNRTGDMQLQHLFFRRRDNTTYLAVNADSFHNSSIGIHFQQAAGIGVGRLIVATGGGAELFADVRGIYRRYYGEDGKEFLGANFGVRTSHVAENGVVTAVLLQATPAVNRPKAWQSGAFLTVGVPIGDSGFALSVTAFDDYVNDAPAKFRKNYLNLTVGVSYSPK